MSQKPSKTIDLLDLLKDGRHFAERRADQIHIIDSVTGNTIVMYNDTRGATVPAAFIETKSDSGATIWIQEGMNPMSTSREMVYSPVTIDLLCQAIVEGGSLTELCRRPEFPHYSTLRRWARSHPWIDEALATARRDRAEYLRDKAVFEADNAEGRDPISGSQLRVDTYKWAAGVDDGKYSPKAKVEATINQPTQIVVMTGIDRTQVPAPIDVTPTDTKDGSK